MKKMNTIEKNPWLITMPRIVLVVFILCNIVAMLSYPGSTYLDNISPGYSFTRNFLSDLGRTISYSGKINFFSAQLFNMSLILTGCVFAFFYIHVWKIFSEDNQGVFAFIGSIFGVLGGLCLVGVGLTPADLYLDIHIICATWLFRFFFVASFCYSIIIFRHIKFENKYAGGYLIFTVSILLYILISELGPDPKISHFALTLQVISQKIILFIFMASIYMQTLGLKKL